MAQTSSFRIGALGLAVALASAPVAAHASANGWDDASSIARDALVAAAIATPAVQGDWNGVLQAGGSMGVAGGISYGLKEAFPETRPDRSDRRSFPSGHTSISFAAAATLENRYGWKAGIPAHVAAVFVGYARVKADKHHWYDVMAGAGIGEAAGLLITRQHDANVQFVPWGDTSGGGISMAMRF